MDTYRALLAIAISFIIIFGYQYFFVKTPPQEALIDQTVVSETAGQQQSEGQQQIIQNQGQPVSAPVSQPVQPVRPAKQVIVDTSLYTATFSEAGAAVESFVLKEHKETNAEDSPGKQLFMDMVKGDGTAKFAWGSVVSKDVYYSAEQDTVSFAGGKGTLVFSARLENGFTIKKIYTFSEDSYLIDLQIKVLNGSGQVMQGSPQIYQVNNPFKSSKLQARFTFDGAAAYTGEELSKVKTKDLEDGPQSRQGAYDWITFEGTYFMTTVMPAKREASTFLVQGNKDRIESHLTGQLETLDPGKEASYGYTLFYGPKRYSLLKEIGHNLDASIDFGWFAIIARPTLWLLNFFHTYLGNYGVAIILVTILFKLVFWPISQRGLKSMKNMQKLQPKMVKIKEKYKNDPQAMNREVMSLYKSYKVNPLGGCLPMVVQIPVFFALYKVLLICIELRHAPFMLWINDLSAADRLWIGFDIPWLGGIPVLTLLMGASMFLQQKMSPTTADPTQQRIMMMLPVVFTFMFLNFASGLVLYWFVNNLLSILQQYLINRSVAKTSPAKA